MDAMTIARALKGAREIAHTPGQRVGNADAAISIADAFNASPGFNRAAFLEACGVYAYTGEAANNARKLGTLQTDTGRNVEVCTLPDGMLAIVTGLPS